MAGYRPEYTIDEEKRILNYIIENDEFHRLKGDRLWKDMQESGQFQRTWQSLKQHFRKKLINKLHYPVLQLDRELQNKIYEYFHGTAAITSRNTHTTTITNRVRAVERVDNHRTGEQSCTVPFRLSSTSSSEDEI